MIAVVIAASLSVLLGVGTASAKGATTEHLTLVDDFNCSGPVTSQRCISTTGLIVTVFTPSGRIHQTFHVVQVHEHFINGVVQSTITNEITKSHHSTVDNREGTTIHGREISTRDNGCVITSNFTKANGETRLDRVSIDCG